MVGGEGGDETESWKGESGVGEDEDIVDMVLNESWDSERKLSSRSDVSRVEESTSSSCCCSPKIDPLSFKLELGFLIFFFRWHPVSFLPTFYT